MTVVYIIHFSLCGVGLVPDPEIITGDLNHILHVKEVVVHHIVAATADLTEITPDDLHHHHLRIPVLLHVQLHLVLLLNVHLPMQSHHLLNEIDVQSCVCNCLLKHLHMI